MGWDTCRHVYIKACFEFVELSEKKNCFCILQLGEMMCFLNTQNNNNNLPLYPAITFGKKIVLSILILDKNNQRTICCAEYHEYHEHLNLGWAFRLLLVVEGNDDAHNIKKIF